ANTGGFLVSFDFNYRPALWPEEHTAAETLRNLARRADVVFIGDDEAEALYPASDHAGLAELIVQRADQELIVKQGSRGATLITHDDSTWESALAATLVDATGAGDAFAAGYLAGRCLDWPSRACLRLGHLLGSLTVSVLEDVPPQLSSAELEALSPETLEARWVGVS
ncbi:MAG: sugar kinase, partial [Acidimicrobiia bacterium]|nr:sugar kinase [Acidimicrobiia bacterium]